MLSLMSLAVVEPSGGAREASRVGRCGMLSSFVHLLERQHGRLLVFFLLLLRHPSPSLELRRELFLALLLARFPRLRRLALRSPLPLDSFLASRSFYSLN